MKNRMLLSEILNEKEKEHLYKDGSFDIFGLLSSHHGNDRICSYLTGAAFVKDLERNREVSCMICPKELVPLLPDTISGILISENPPELFWELHSRIPSPDAPTVIGEGCSISKLAYIADRNVRIGNHVVIEEFVSIKEGTTIGDDCVIRAGSVVGGEGFQVIEKSDGKRVVVKHKGRVVFGKNVEIQQSVVVDKALFSWDETVLEDGVKIDNAVHIAHAVKLGENTKVSAGVIFGGYVSTGKDCWFGLNSTIRNTITIGNNAFISMGSVVTKSLEDNAKVSGNFAIDHALFINELKKRCQ